MKFSVNDPREKSVCVFDIHGIWKQEVKTHARDRNRNCSITSRWNIRKATKLFVRFTFYSEKEEKSERNGETERERERQREKRQGPFSYHRLHTFHPFGMQPAMEPEAIFVARISSSFRALQMHILFSLLLVSTTKFSLLPRFVFVYPKQRIPRWHDFVNPPFIDTTNSTLTRSMTSNRFIPIDESAPRRIVQQLARFSVQYIQSYSCNQCKILNNIVMSRIDRKKTMDQHFIVFSKSTNFRSFSVAFLCRHSLSLDLHILTGKLTT